MKMLDTTLTQEQQKRRRGERGSVTVMTAVFLVGLVLVLGLSIDVSRIYLVRSGLQNAADAAALAAARELNSGTGGLADAVTQAKAVALQANKYSFNRTGINAPSVTITKVEFSTSLATNATWYDNTITNNVPAGTEVFIKYVRVTTQTASVSMLFAARALGATRVEQRTAIAGMSVGLNTICNFFPIAVSLTNPFPANGAQLTFNFTNVPGGGNVTLVNNGYVVLETPDISGNGLPETAKLAAGLTTMSATIGGTLKASSSANGSNGPRAIADGANLRFDIPANGYGNLNATDYPPDSNTFEPLSGPQYLSKSPLTPPPLHPPGQDDRRVLIMPILPVGIYPQTAIPTVRFGAFLLRSRVPRTGANSGAFSVEYLGDDFPIPCGYFDPAVVVPPAPGGVAAPGLTKPVLYR